MTANAFQMRPGLELRVFATVKQYQMNAKGERIELDPELFMFSREMSGIWKKEQKPSKPAQNPEEELKAAGKGKGKGAKQVKAPKIDANVPRETYYCLDFVAQYDRHRNLDDLYLHWGLTTDPTSTTTPWIIPESEGVSLPLDSQIRSEGSAVGAIHTRFQ
jgi:hypothetical protein